MNHSFSQLNIKIKLLEFNFLNVRVKKMFNNVFFFFNIGGSHPLYFYLCTTSIKKLTKSVN